MPLNLYFKSANFNSNSELANFIFGKLRDLGFNPSAPEDEAFMFVIRAKIANEIIFF